MYQNVIKYLTHLILNNVKLDQRQTPMMHHQNKPNPNPPPTHPLNYIVPIEPTFQEKGVKPICCITTNSDQCMMNLLTFTLVHEH